MGTDTIFREEQFKNLKTDTEFERFEKENVKEMKGFGDYLVELMEAKGLRSTDVEDELKEYVSHTYFHECKNNTKIPSRSKAIQMGIAIDASVDEINEMLKFAKHSKLYVKDKADFKIMIGIQKRQDKDELYEIAKDAKTAKRYVRRK